jgi:SpoVK/Ycf46/Vps4 family AAA+-type ATPase
VRGVDLEALARETDGLSGSDLAMLCQQAAMAEIRALSDSGAALDRALPALRVAQARLLAALTTVRRGRDARGRR